MGSSYDNEMKRKQFLPYRMGYLTDWMVQLAKEELGETEEVRKQALQELRKVIAKDKQLKIWTDDSFLLPFLRARKFDVKRSWELLHHFFVLKKEFPEIYPREVDTSKIKELQEETNGGGIYPYRDKHGSPIVFFKIGAWEPDKYPLPLVLSALTFAVLQTIEDPATQVCGVRLLVDGKGIGLRHIREFTPRYLQAIAKALRNTLPVRFTGIHVVNESAIFSYLYSIIKIFHSEKIRKRIHFHGTDLKNLHKYIPKEILPPEYEGENTDFCPSEWNKKEMHPYLQRYEELHRTGYS